MVLGVLLIGAIIGMGLVLLYLRPPTALVLPISAIVIALIAVTPRMIGGYWQDATADLLSTVIAQGLTRLSLPIVAVILGAVIAEQVKDAQVMERIVTYGAEFAGDSPFFLTVILLLITAFLFTNLGGLGAVIMVATAVVPLLLAMGLDKLTAGGVFLLGLSLGGALNPVNWQFYISILGLETETIIPFALALFAIFLLVAIVFIFFRIYSSIGLRRQEVFTVVGLILVLGIFVLLLFAIPELIRVVEVAIFGLLALSLAISVVLVIARFLLKGLFPEPVNPLSVFALLFPLVLILTVNLGSSLGYLTELKMDIISALFLGVLYAHLSTVNLTTANSRKSAGKVCAKELHTQNEANRIMRAVFEGFKMAIPAIVLLFGIGMLLKAVTLPEVVSAVQPITMAIVPTSGLAYVLGFALLSPLALYRGPLNLYGMGSGIMGVILATGALPPPLIMSAFFSVGMMQGVCDPTNTHNAWLAGLLGVRIIDLTRVTFLFVLIVVLLGLLSGWLLL